MKKGITIKYAIKRNGKYLQGIEINERYQRDAVSPTMGVCHTFGEYKTIWGKEKKCFEHLTASNYIKILFEEYRWQNKKAIDIKVEPEIKGE